MEVEPVRFLRPEIKFPSLEELKSQLARDAAHAAEALEEGSKTQKTVKWRMTA